MICPWRSQYLLLLVVVLARCCRAERHGRAIIPKESNGVVRLKHGSFNCLGALLTSRVVLTCCTCVSDVYFSCENKTDQVSYEVRALSVEDIIVKSEDQKRVPGKEVFIHPQCDIDGTYDYGLVTLKFSVQTGKENDCMTAFRKGFSNVYNPLPDALEISSQTKKMGHMSSLCVMHTILDESADGEVVQILTEFVDWKQCWNGSETKPAFVAKYCIRTVDDKTSMEKAKCGSPVFCNHKLVGILARRYALGGIMFSAVNGLDGAIEFVRETVKLDIQDDGGNTEEEDQGLPLDKKTIKRKRRVKSRNRMKKSNPK